MDSRPKIALLLLFPMLGTSAFCPAQVPYVGPYAGGDELMARLDPKRSTAIRDTNAVKDRYLGWKGLVGMRFTPQVAFEAGFMDFGKISPAVTTNAASQARTKAFTAFGVGMVPVGKFEMFAKAGPTRTQAIGHANGTFFERQHKKIAWGTGLQLTRRRLAVRAEYEKFGSSSMGDLDAVSLGFRISFHPPGR